MVSQNATTAALDDPRALILWRLAALRRVAEVGMMILDTFQGAFAQLADRLGWARAGKAFERIARGLRLINALENKLHADLRLAANPSTANASTPPLPRKPSAATAPLGNGATAPTANAATPSTAPTASARSSSVPSTTSSPASSPTSAPSPVGAASPKPPGRMSWIRRRFSRWG